jgi:hypothetical protein
MAPAAPGLQIANAAFRDMERASDGLRELFLPLDQLLIRGGDPRLIPDSGGGRNKYGWSVSTLHQARHRRFRSGPGGAPKRRARS